MAITLDALTLPPDLLWQDEFAWTRTSGSAQRTVSGRLVSMAAAAPGDSGRPITLGNDHAWILRSDLKVLQEWAGFPGREMLLTLHDGASFLVLFRHWDAPIMETAPVVDYADPDDATLYRLQALKLVIP